MTERIDHVVIGGGAMGSAAAWQLARRGREVVLLERFAPGHAQGASHGASRIHRSTYAQPEYLDLLIEAAGLWRLLEAEAGTRLLTSTGGVSHGADRAPRERVAAALRSRGIAHEWLDPAEAAERWPGLRFEGPVLHEGATAGRLHADRAVEALQRAAGTHGAVVRHRTRVLELRIEGDVVRVLGEGVDLLARRAVVAAGAWTGGLLDGLLPAGWRLPLVVTQEQPAHFALRPGAPEEEAWPSFTHAPGSGPVRGGSWPSGVYGLATPGEGIKAGFHGVGPVVDPDHRSYRPEPGQLALLREYVSQWIPGVDPDALEPISCTYTTTPDADFILDRIGPLVIAAGFSGHGFKFTPAVGRLLADLADPSGTATTPARFSLRRAALAAAQPARALPA